MGSRGRFWAFALKNLRSRPARGLLSIVGLSIPVLGFLGLFSLSGGIRELLGDALARVRGILVLRENAPTDLFSELPVDMAERLRRIPGVRVVAPQIWKISPPIEGRGLFARRSADHSTRSRPHAPSLEGLLNLVQVEGQDVAEHARLKSDVFRGHLLPGERGGGRFLDPTDCGMPHVVISAKLAADYPGADGHPRRAGDAIRIGRQSFTIVGIYDTGSLLFDNTIVMEIMTARRLLALKDETVSCFMVETVEPARIDAVAEAIERAIPEVDARTMSQFKLGLGRFLANLDALLLLVIGLALVVAVAGIVNTMLMSTTERLAEFGVMRCNGWSKGDVLRLVVAESGCLGLFAGVVGCLLAVAGVTAANRFLGRGLQLVLTPGLLGLGLALAIVLGTIGGLYPAWRASRLIPMDAIRRGSR
jgi:putative ABC transport system permease protein